LTRSTSSNQTLINIVFLSIILSQFVNGWHYYKDYLDATIGQRTPSLLNMENH